MHSRSQGFWQLGLQWTNEFPSIHLFSRTLLWTTKLHVPFGPHDQIMTEFFISGETCLKITILKTWPRVAEILPWCLWSFVFCFQQTVKECCKKPMVYIQVTEILIVLKNKLLHYKPATYSGHYPTRTWSYFIVFFPLQRSSYSNSPACFHLIYQFKCYQTTCSFPWAHVTHSLLNYM